MKQLPPYTRGLVIIERFGIGEGAREFRSEIQYVGTRIVGTSMGEYDALTGMGLMNDLAKGVYSSIRLDRHKAAGAAPSAGEIVDNGGMSS